MSEKEPVKIRLSTVILLFIIFILIISIIFICFYFKNFQNGNIDNVQSNVTSNTDTSTTEPVENNNIIQSDENIDTTEPNKNSVTKVVSLNINSKEVKNLYKYIMKINTNQEKLVYRNKKVTLSNLNNQLKLITIFENLNKSDIYQTKSLTNENGDKVKHTYYKKNTIEKVAKKIFGNNVTIKHESCEAFFAFARDYKNGIYDCYEYEGGGGVLWENSSSKLIKAEQAGNEIYIYDKYVHIYDNSSETTEKWNIYSSSDKSVKLASNVNPSKYNLYDGDMINNIENYINKEVSTFKHTFKKASDGSYYWYSTEPI